MSTTRTVPPTSAAPAKPDPGPGTARKVIVFALILLVLAAVVVVSLLRRNRNQVTIQTERAARADIASIVTASGQIMPQTYADISPNNVGQITNLYVKEGDQVHKGELLAKLWNRQQAATVAGMEASLKTSQANLAAQQAAVGTAQANVTRDTAQLQQVSQQWARTQALFKDQLLARSAYESEEAAYKTAQANLSLSQAALKQSHAQVAALEAQIQQAEASLASAQDVLSRTEFTSPLDGVVTYLPVHVGDTVVMGIQNSPGSTLMRIADMSKVNAEVQVDETDIANVRVGQPATITIDAYGDQTFPGHVIEVGDTAIIRATGAAATSSTGSAAQQAKDFTVKIQMDKLPPGLRPGLSCTAKVTTATASNAIVVPLQSVVERDPSQLKPQPNATTINPVPSAVTPAQTPLQGIFVVDPKTQTAVFTRATTGVTGIDHIQVLTGVKPGDQVVSGPYTALRTMANHARVKIDNSVVTTTAPSS